MVESGTGAKDFLRVDNLQAWYGESHVLHGVNFVINKGEVVTLLGRNGAGKTTTLKSIMGIVSRRNGSISYGGWETVGAPANVIARRGIAYVPEERGIFSSLSVEENLLLPPVVRTGGMSVDGIVGEIAAWLKADGPRAAYRAIVGLAARVTTGRSRR